MACYGDNFIHWFEETEIIRQFATFSPHWIRQCPRCVKMNRHFSHPFCQGVGWCGTKHILPWVKRLHIIDQILSCFYDYEQANTPEAQAKAKGPMFNGAPFDVWLHHFDVSHTKQTFNLYLQPNVCLPCAKQFIENVLFPNFKIKQGKHYNFWNPVCD